MRIFELVRLEAATAARTMYARTSDENAWIDSARSAERWAPVL